MQDLPIHPSRGTEAPGVRLEKRRERLRTLPAAKYDRAIETLRLDCVFETLRLTGKGVSRELVSEVAGRQGAFAARHDDELLVSGQIAALDAVDEEAQTARDLTLSLIRRTHRLSSPPSDGSLRTEPIDPQFQGARTSPARFIEARLQNLLAWLAAESARSMYPPERMALFFARYVEIAPFPHGNFRSAHLLVNFFARSAGYPFVMFRLDEADGVREDVERAMRFDTLALVRRFTGAMERSLRACEEQARDDDEDRGVP